MKRRMVEIRPVGVLPPQPVVCLVGIGERPQPEDEPQAEQEGEEGPVAVEDGGEHGVARCESGLAKPAHRAWV